MLQALYTMMIVTEEEYAICKHKFELKYGALKKVEKYLFGSVEKTYYHDDDDKYSYETYFYREKHKIPMPLFQEAHSPNNVSNEYFINKMIIKQEGYNVSNAIS